MGIVASKFEAVRRAPAAFADRQRRLAATLRAFGNHYAIGFGDGDGVVAMFAKDFGDGGTQVFRRGNFAGNRQDKGFRRAIATAKPKPLRLLRQSAMLLLDLHCIPLLSLSFYPAGV
jgi:hypothetical protein